MPLLEVRDLYAGYGETEILHGISAAVDYGEVVTIIGPNGAGKSTLIKVVIGILKPTRGTVRFRESEIGGANPEDLVTKGLAYVPQNRNIFPSLTVLENLEMGAITRRPGALHRANELAKKAVLELVRRAKAAEGTTTRLSDREFRARIDHISEIFPNLKPKMRHRAGTLSGGEQQMVALGKALVLDPLLLLIDEPSAGLAPKFQSMIFEKVREINEHGAAIVLVEQNARKALALADRGYVLEMGRNRYEGSGASLLADPEVGRLYLGG